MEPIKPAPPLPILVPFEPKHFWEELRLIIRQEVKAALSITDNTNVNGIPGLPAKPLYKIDEICKVLRVSKPTIYEWIHQGKISPYRIGTRTFFLYDEVKRILQPKANGIGYKNL